MSNATGSPRDAASVLFDLPGYRVETAVDLPDGGREVIVAAVAVEAACPDCGVLSRRVTNELGSVFGSPGRRAARGGSGQATLHLRRGPLRAADVRRGQRQVPLRARATTRLRTVVLDAVVRAGRVVSAVAATHGLSWWTVRRTVLDAAVLLTDPASVVVRRLGIDEHRYRSVRFYRDTTGAWRRFEPWMTTIVDADTGRVLGIVDGRDSAGVGGWLAARAQAWRDGVEVVAIDPSAAFRRAIRQQLPRAALSVDAFHLVKLGNDMVTRVRQRYARSKGRRGRLVDPAWVNRRSSCAPGTPCPPGPGPGSGRPWPRTIPRTRSARPGVSRSGCANSCRPTPSARRATPGHPGRRRHSGRDARDRPAPGHRPGLVAGHRSPRRHRRHQRPNRGREHSMKQIKRSGRGYRNAAHYKARILLASAARRAA